jgi:hypothetical protein
LQLLSFEREEIEGFLRICSTHTSKIMMTSKSGKRSTTGCRRAHLHKLLLLGKTAMTHKDIGFFSYLKSKKSKESKASNSERIGKQSVAQSEKEFYDN